MTPLSWVLTYLAIGFCLYIFESIALQVRKYKKHGKLDADFDLTDALFNSFLWLPHLIIMILIAFCIYFNKGFNKFVNSSVKFFVKKDKG